jgi:hypothetical protein
MVLRTHKGYIKDTQRMHKGYIKDTQRMHKGYIKDTQRMRNPLKIRKHLNYRGKLWI